MHASANHNLRGSYYSTYNPSLAHTQEVMHTLCRCATVQREHSKFLLYVCEYEMVYFLSLNFVPLGTVYTLYLCLLPNHVACLTLSRPHTVLLHVQISTYQNHPLHTHTHARTHTHTHIPVGVCECCTLQLSSSALVLASPSTPATSDTTSPPPSRTTSQPSSRLWAVGVAE